MSAATKDLVIKQGDSVSLFFRLRTQVYDSNLGQYVPGEYRNLTGLVGKAQLRQSAASPDVLAEFAVTIADQTSSSTIGGVLLKLTPLQTEGLVPSPTYPSPSLVWDFELADAATAPTWRKTYLEGSVAVKSQVTR